MRDFKVWNSSNVAADVMVMWAAEITEHNTHLLQSTTSSSYTTYINNLSICVSYVTETDASKAGDGLFYHFPGQRLRSTTKDLVRTSVV